MINLLIMLGVGVGLDLLLGDPHSPAHPVAVFGRYATWVENQVRAGVGSSVLAGFLGWFLATLPPTALALGSVWVVERGLNAVMASVAAGLWFYFTIALRSLIQHARAVRAPLVAGDIVTARKALSMIVSRDTNELSRSEIVRGGIESVAENLSDAVTGAFFWAVVGYLIYGLPVAVGASVLLRAVNTLDACWGYKNERYLYFGKFAARMDDLVFYIPARLTTLVIALVAVGLGGSFFRTLATVIRHRNDHPSPNSGWCMAAFAGALEIRLGGPTFYDGILESYPYWGTGRSDLDVDDLQRAERLAIWSAVVFVLILLGVVGAVRCFLS